MNHPSSESLRPDPIPVPSPTPEGGSRRCRFCAHSVHTSFVDLGMSPLCQTHIAPDQRNHMERFYPLHARVCEHCLLVQLDEYVAPGDIFSEYAYFSSFSDSWVAHAKHYCEAMRARFGLDAHSRVIEIASNDGYLLQHFVAMKIPVLGIEPAANIAQAAAAKGVPTLSKFFGRQSAREIVIDHGRAQLLLGNNVLAHVPDLNDFVGGLKILLADDGVLTMEFPHLYQLIQQSQFDTIYHEHFSYFSFFTVEQVFKFHGLVLFDVEEIPTHGGSLRIYGRHEQDPSQPVCASVAALRAKEIAAGLTTLPRYQAFGEQVKTAKRELLSMLIGLKAAGQRIVGYGAPGKGNTLLNYCGIRRDFLDFTVDRNPYKQGKFLPGTHIPILEPAALLAARPDYVLILPWNLEQEIVAQLAPIRAWGGKFIIPIPAARIV